MTTKRLYLAVASAVLGGLCIIGVNSRAEARGSGALLGTSAAGGHRVCFNDYGGGVRNDCAVVAHFVLPIIDDTGGGRTIHVAATGVDGTAKKVKCQAASVNNDGSQLRTSAWLSTQEHTGATEILKLPINGFGWGATYAYCVMDPGTVIRNYHY